MVPEKNGLPLSYFPGTLFYFQRLIAAKGLGFFSPFFFSSKGFPFHLIFSH